MKRVILSMAAVAALATALPAAAQGYGGQGFGPQGWGHRFNDNRIELRIDQGIRDGSLIRREARGLRSQLNDARRLESAYSRDGRISASESRDLDRRYAALNMRLRWERSDGDNRNVGARDYNGGRGYGGGYRNGGYR